MGSIRSFMVLLVLSFQSISSKRVARVTCVFSQSCVLPCSDSSSSDVINWSRLTPADGTVHCYYGNQDQLGQQDQNFRGRTSLFTDQISRGNASLLLTGVKVQDEGTYRCNTSGNKLVFIHLRVEGGI
ncbi:V-set domain-containing T-cell activation inhibitor 1-like [Poecilia latipinna]|uniref:V-set domain-containing T-cell activation inhibitor 1-like n=1 Tax=Poecilia latipinna TaxID=48699 RepID=UPI00072E3065|nr:PREDICTED: V-set domain-containing T-cell activation inhibitor 1-like [Poecilia latipinna]